MGRGRLAGREDNGERYRHRSASAKFDGQARCKAGVAQFIWGMHDMSQ